jgi:argininosuccinate lyase
MLAATRLISDEDCAAIRDGLNALLESFGAGEWQISLEDEDVHTALESRLTASIGPAGGRLHLGRSRNDQVLTALRLYLRDAALDLAARVENLRSSLADLATRQGDVEIPGYTHMQHAMPSSVALWCGGFDEGLADAVWGLRSAQERMNKNPLGSAAGYGTPGLPLDREMTTAKLDFASTQSPVTAVQLSRGKVESVLLFEIALMMQDLGRMASDLLLFYTQEFAYISLAADVTTGSSIMPQKRNPDVLELLRASSVTAQACLDESLMITAKLPSGYHRDLQSTSWRTCSKVFGSCRRTSRSTKASSQPPRLTRWCVRKVFLFAMLIGRSPNATQNDAPFPACVSIIVSSPLWGIEMTRITTALTAIFFLLLFSACGQSGPLYLPGDPSEIQKPAPAPANGEEEEEKNEEDSDAPMG